MNAIFVYENKAFKYINAACIYSLHLTETDLIIG